MKELKIHVERAVRPVRASDFRKDRMREELLTHLTQIYQEEFARLGNESQAVAMAQQRFGEPAEVTRELQASVPRWERILFFPLLPDPPFQWMFPSKRDNGQKRAGVTGLSKYWVGTSAPPKQEQESAFRFAARSSWLNLSLVSVAILVVLLVALRVRGRLLPPNVVQFGMAVIVAYSVNCYCFPLFLHLIRQAVFPKNGRTASWVRAAFHAFMAGLLVVASSFGCLCLLGGGHYSWIDDVVTDCGSSLLILACLTPFFYLLVGYLWALDANRYKEWGRLEI